MPRLPKGLGPGTPPCWRVSCSPSEWIGPRKPANFLFFSLKRPSPKSKCRNSGSEISTTWGDALWCPLKAPQEGRGSSRGLTLGETHKLTSGRKALHKRPMIASQRAFPNFNALSNSELGARTNPKNSTAEEIPFPTGEHKAVFKVQTSRKTGAPFWAGILEKKEVPIRCLWNSQSVWAPHVFPKTISLVSSLSLEVHLRPSTSFPKPERSNCVLE